jgi:hypothetical protein
MIAKTFAARAARNEAFGPVRTIRTVLGSTASTSLIGSARNDPYPLMFLTRSSEKRTSSAVTGLPVLNTASRSLNV